MKESAHWYDASGKSCHTMATKPGAKNATRPTTIKDARALALFPSVTTILGILAKPQLDDWKQKQVQDATRRMMAVLVGIKEGEQPTQERTAQLMALVNPLTPADLGVVQAFQQSCITEAFRQVEEAADAGTLIHAGAEAALQGLDYDKEAPVYLPKLAKTFPLKTFIEPIVQFVEEHEIRVTGHELRTVNHREGYAGTIDAVMRSKRGLGILDFKTRKTDPRYPCEPYDGQPMQIAAYHVSHYGSIPEAEAHVAGCNLYISTTEPGRVEGCWYDGTQLEREWNAFAHVAALWRHLKGYDPRTNRPTA
jgi:hypothetical protein